MDVMSVFLFVRDGASIFAASRPLLKAKVCEQKIHCVFWHFLFFYVNTHPFLA